MIIASRVIWFYAEFVSVCCWPLLAEAARRQGSSFDWTSRRSIEGGGEGGRPESVSVRMSTRDIAHQETACEGGSIHVSYSTGIDVSNQVGAKLMQANRSI